MRTTADAAGGLDPIGVDAVIGGAARLVNRHLDRLAQPRVALFGRRWDALPFCLCIGITLGTTSAVGLALRAQLSAVVMTVVCVVPVLLGALLFEGPRITGRRPSPFLRWARDGVYHYQIVILASATALLHLLGSPVLAYLDVFVIGFGIAQAAGRVGCFMAGCCHGRPHPWGVRYGNEGLQTGQPHCLHGIRLFPVQLLEALWLVALTIVSFVRIVRGSGPGEILAWYLLAYAAGRFLLEFARADVERPYFGGFSEAQWTALLVLAGLAVAEISGLLPLHPWHLAAPVLMACGMAGIAAARHRAGPRTPPLFEPQHLRELVASVGWIAGLLATDEVPVGLDAGQPTVYEAVTSRHVQLSGTRLSTPDGWTYRYALRSQAAVLTAEDAEALAFLIRQREHPRDPYALTRVGRGVFRLSVNVASGLPTG